MRSDFTSGLFLGLRHSRACCTPDPLTTGKPAALEDPADAAALADALAAGQGAGAGVLARSSLHGLIDVLASTVPPGGRVLLDEAVYPIGRWAVDTVRARGVTVRAYRHHDGDDVRRSLGASRRPAVVLTDAWCGGCLRPAPLPALCAAASAAGATVLVDDSLAAGVVGHRSIPADPLGVDGAGTAAWHGLAGDRLVSVASTAKGYAAPLAVVTGPRWVVARIRRAGPARMHGSPPSRCDIAALRSALADPALPARRRRLGRHIDRVRREVAALGLRPLGRPFPVVSIPLPQGAALAAQHRLARAGIAVLVTRSPCTAATCLTVCLRADHRAAEVDRLIDVLGRSTLRGAA